MKCDIVALKRKMLVKYPFFGSIVTNVDYKEQKSILTAGTDGKTIYYNPEYLKSLSTEEQTFIFAHEVCHIAFNHILRSEGKDPELWNIATDAVINQFLKRDGLKMASGGVDIAEAINYNAEQFYEKLLQEKQQGQEESSNSQNENNEQQSESSKQGNKTGKSSQTQGESNQDNSQQNQENNSSNTQNENNQQQSSQSQGQSNQSQKQSNGEPEKDSQEEQKQNIGHDTHSMWADAVKKHKEEKEKSSSGKAEEKSQNNQEKEKKKEEELEKKQEELENMGEKDAFKKNREEKKKQLEELKEAISKQASQAGSKTNSIVREVNDIGTSKPIVDWRYVLREAIKYEVDWSYQNATIEYGVVTPNLEEQPMPETEIVLDTSSSIAEVLLKNFLRECKNILKYSKLKVGCFDTKFYGFHDIKTEEDIEKMRFEGGGGTDFTVAINAFSRRVENKIIFTDGEASMPDTPLDAIWMVFGSKKINPKGGKVIHITKEQLDKLYLYETESNTKGKIKQLRFRAK